VSERVISVRGLEKSYGAVEAVRGIDLEVHAGEVFAFLGPNGAGKTTTVEVLEGYRPRDAGAVTVLGADPARAGRDWRARIGVVLQASRVQAELSVRESLELFAGYYPHPRPVGETMDRVELSEQAERRTGKLSGGQRRRLDVALALVGDPDLVFLDEPTTGFDPSARKNAWKLVSNLRELGKTVFLTTHYMDEAQALADRVAIIVRGRIVSEGTPEEIAGHDRGAPVISFRLPAGVSAAELPAQLAAVASVRGDRVEARIDSPVTALHALTGWALERGVDLPALEVRRTSLEDAYLDLTAESGPPAAAAR
jgi:ABC-2 type transport system ATP-binding protein